MPLILLPPLSISDGDTPEVKMGVRLLGMDAPELHFPLGSDPVCQGPFSAKLPKLKVYKDLPQALRGYLTPRLEGAGTRQKKWGRCVYRGQECPRHGEERNRHLKVAPTTGGGAANAGIPVTGRRGAEPTARRSAATARGEQARGARRDCCVGLWPPGIDGSGGIGRPAGGRCIFRGQECPRHGEERNRHL